MSAKLNFSSGGGVTLFWGITKTCSDEFLHDWLECHPSTIVALKRCESALKDELAPWGGVVSSEWWRLNVGSCANKGCKCSKAEANKLWNSVSTPDLTGTFAFWPAVWCCLVRLRGNPKILFYLNEVWYQPAVAVWCVWALCSLDGSSLLFIGR